MTNPHYSSVELFTGAGGLALGVAAAGFHHRLLLEYNRDACKTLRLNHAAFGGTACQIHEGDVRSFDFQSFAGTDLLAAGAPCQPFSIGGKHRADADDRNLFPQVFRAIREIQPRAVLVENVKGLLRANLADFVEFIELQLAFPLVLPSNPLRAAGWKSHLSVLRRVSASGIRANELSYNVRKVLLNAANFGVPQRRERVFFVAIRSDIDTEWAAPAPSHSAAALRFAEEITGSYWQGHGMRRRAAASTILHGRLMREAGTTKPWTTVRDALRGLPEPLKGAQFAAFVNHVGQPGARSYPGHTGSALDAPGKTLKAGVHGVPGGENMLRRVNGSVRYFTVREAARIQTFPDSYAFTGAWGEAMRQIRNAVPVSLAQVVARSIRRCLLAADSHSPHQPRPARRPSYVQGELSESLVRSA